MVREFSQLIHLMEKGFTPRDYGSGWKILQPDSTTGEPVLVDIERFAVSQAKRFDCIEVVEDETGRYAVLKGDARAHQGEVFPVPSNDLTPLQDAGRLRALERTGLMNSPPEWCYDHLTRLATSVLHCPIALVSLVSAERQWFKSSHGVPEDLHETALPDSLCKFVAASRTEMIVVDTRTHPLAKASGIVKELDIGAYAGFPIFSADGQALGAFCVMDHKARKWTKMELELLKEFADLANLCIEAHELRHHTLERPA